MAADLEDWVVGDLVEEAWALGVVDSRHWEVDSEEVSVAAGWVVAELEALRGAEVAGSFLFLPSESLR